MNLRVSILFFMLCYQLTNAFLIASDSTANVPHILSDEQSSVYTKFTAYYPDNKILKSSLYLRGDNCNLTWNKGVPMTRISEDTWSTSMLCPQNTKISVKALQNDTKWMMGANKVFYSSATRQVLIYPSFNPSINQIIETSPIHSKTLNNSRKLSIYFPPSYYDNTLKQYKLLLLHDGQNLFDPHEAAFGVAWKCQDTANSLIISGDIEQIIIVGIWNTQQRNSEYTYSYDKQEKFGGKGNAYLDFIQKQVMNELTQKHLKGRLISQASVAIGGSSLGGLISCYGAYTRPQLFNNAICMSSSFWWNNEDFKNVILADGKYKDSKFYLDSGDSGPGSDSKNQTIGVFQKMKSIGYKTNSTIFYYLDKGGQHNQYYWGKRFKVPLVRLFSADDL